MDPPDRDGVGEGLAGDHWRKPDVIDNNRCGSSSSGASACSPARATTTRPSSCPASCTPGNDYGTPWHVHVYGSEAHGRRRRRCRRTTSRCATPTTCPHARRASWSRRCSTAIVTGRARDLPVNLPNAGNVTNLPDGAVVEIMGTVDADGVRGPRHARRCRGSWASSCAASTSSQELTVEAALTGDRELVFEAMLADPIVGRSAYDDIAAMTDEMLAATAPLAPAVRR